jgi:aspartyl-tRNA(Asn)/glutamyl-tRNA(Gln) amidotransferase subunit C
MDIKSFLANAKLKLTEAEEQKLAPVLADLLKSFDAVANANLSNVAPLITVSDTQNDLREDIVNQTIAREALLKTAPETHDGYFVVPKTID